MFSAMLLTISIVALSQFALYYWRAVLAGVAAQPVSDRVLAAAQVENGRVTPGHFQTLAGLHDLGGPIRPVKGGLAETAIVVGMLGQVTGRVVGCCTCATLPS